MSSGSIGAGQSGPASGRSGPDQRIDEVLLEDEE